MLPLLQLLFVCVCNQIVGGWVWNFIVVGWVWTDRAFLYAYTQYLSFFAECHDLIVVDDGPRCEL